MVCVAFLSDRKCHPESSTTTVRKARSALALPGSSAGSAIHSLTVAHTRAGNHVTLPADHVTDSVELGYATTVHEPAEPTWTPDQQPTQRWAPLAQRLAPADGPRPRETDLP
jgi:hypothetical protein